jgi:hypothetical protein
VIGELVEGMPQHGRQNRLAANEHLMRYIVGGGKVVVEMGDWVNKSLGRTPINIYTVDKQGHDLLSKAYGIMYTSYTHSPARLYRHLFRRGLLDRRRAFAFRTGYPGLRYF